MKRLHLTTMGFLLVCAGFSVTASDFSIDNIKSMVEKIHQKRRGVSLIKLDQTQEPFVELIETDSHGEESAMIRRATERIPEVKLKLHAIMNGRAFINKRWIKEGEKISGFRLVHIGKRGVVLQSNRTIKRLFLYTKTKHALQLITKD